MGRAYKSCYCAFCKSPRRVFARKHIGFAEILYSFALAFSLGLVVWQELNPRFIPVAITFMGLAEILTQLRWRTSLPCKKCGFDPLLYLESPQKASDKVRAFLERRLADPNQIDKALPILLEKRAQKVNAAPKAELPTLR